MIFVAILLYSFLSVFDAGIVGGLLAFLLSRRGRIVPIKTLALSVLVVMVLQDLLISAMVAPWDLKLTTDNPLLVRLFGSSDLSSVFQPSFDLFDMAFYAVDVLIGTWIGTFLVSWHSRRVDVPRTESNAPPG